MPDRLRFRPRVTRLPAELAPPSLAAALSRLRARRRPALLDSAGGSPARFSLLGFDPLPPPPPRDLAGLRSFVAGLEAVGGDPLPPFFHGGFLGALAYDLGVAGESQALPPGPPGLPPIVGGLYTDFLLRDEEAGATWLVLGEDPGDGRPGVAARRAGILADLARRDPRPRESPRALGPPLRRVLSALHRARIERARRSIAAGEMLQVNLAHPLTCRVAGDPVDLYLRLRRANPGPYLGFLRFSGQGGPAALLSSSPELLLAFGEEGGEPVVRTRPIKGTAPRGATPGEDAERAAALLASAKDRAELAMIVDLERNDLGRIAEVGSVRVEAFPRLESYAGVHHLVADVAARPRRGIDAVDALAALFPGGSITGAPKLAAMAAIAELEGEGRGFFTGSLGFLDTRGRASFNILIRTLVWRAEPGGGSAQGEVSFHVGGGITWASDPAAEDEETLTKGAALVRALSPAGEGARREPVPTT